MSPRPVQGPDPLRAFERGTCHVQTHTLCHLVAWLVAITSGAGAGDTLSPPSDHRYVIRTDGSVLRLTHSEETAEVRGRASPSVCYHFGLPSRRPIRQWRDETSLPIYHTRWEQGGIRYTQTVFLTRLEVPSPGAGTPPDSKEVLFVQIVGENASSQYADAAAAFALEADGRPVELELRDGLVYRTRGATSELVGGMDVAAEGVASASGTQLRFRGHMPPGTSGSMTVKLLTAPPGRDEPVNPLRDLEFDDALRRAKRWWKEQPAGDTVAESRLRFEKPID